VIHPEETASASPAPSSRDRARASTLVEELLASVQSEWRVSRPHTESLWQLAGE
jgi:hypothetical protein